MSKLKSVDEILAALVRAGVEIALVRHSYLLADDEAATEEETRAMIMEIAEDAANAVQGIDTCSGHPIAEFMNAQKALNPYKPLKKVKEN